MTGYWRLSCDMHYYVYILEIIIQTLSKGQTKIFISHEVLEK